MREITKEVKSLVVRDGTTTALVVLTPAVKFIFLSTVLIEESIAGIGVVGAPSSKAHKQPSSKYLRQVRNFPLLHFQDVVGNFAIEHGSGLDGNAITAARDTCLTYLYGTGMNYPRKPWIQLTLPLDSKFQLLTISSRV